MNKYSMYVNTEELKKARKMQKKSHKEMSELLGLQSPVSYYNIENGIVQPKISQMIRISEIFMKPIEIFFNFKTQKN